MANDVPDDDALSAFLIAQEHDSSPNRTVMGLGIAAAFVGAAALGYGVYRHGRRYGWWGPNAEIVVDDQEQSTDQGERTDQPGRGDSSNSRLAGKPPNISGDAAGYNTDFFPSPLPVRLALNRLGYSVPLSDNTLVPNGRENPEVRRFQTHWNRLVGRLGAGERLGSPNALKHVRGSLSVDGIPGRNTLNALEISWLLQKSSGIRVIKEGA